MTPQVRALSGCRPCTPSEGPTRPVNEPILLSRHGARAPAAESRESLPLFVATQNLSAAEQVLRDAAREYHRNPSRGKISVTPTKPLSNQRDLSPGLSFWRALPAWTSRPTSKAFDYTPRGNLVGVITNGTAVLGLKRHRPAGRQAGDGSWQGLPFKKFAGVDVFDIELAERDPDKLIEIIASLEPTLGGINLEDIKAPECFYIERELSKRMNIPVFHDDQHGTAIISSRAAQRPELVGKQIGDVKVAVSGGAAAIACLERDGGPGREARKHLRVRLQGRIYEGRPGGLTSPKPNTRKDRRAYAG